jgi:ribosome-binding protein aMBF1 (putative translation factor)
MTVNYRERRAALDTKMTAAERAVYNEAYSKAAVTMRVAEMFYDARTGCGLTQSELAKRMRTTQPTIAEIEGGGRIPSIDMLERLAAATGHELTIALTPPASGEVLDHANTGEPTTASASR